MGRETNKNKIWPFPPGSRSPVRTEAFRVWSLTLQSLCHRLHLRHYRDLQRPAEPEESIHGKHLKIWLSITVGDYMALYQTTAPDSPQVSLVLAVVFAVACALQTCSWLQIREQSLKSNPKPKPWIRKGPITP